MPHDKSTCSEKVFKEIFERYSKSIIDFVYYKCGDIQISEDIVQEAYIKLWDNCKKVESKKAKSFLMKVAQNAFYNLNNHRKVALKFKEIQQTKKKIEHKSPEFVLEEKEFSIALGDSISGLPMEQREVFLLHRMDKKTYREISEIIGKSQKTVERRMHLALCNLRNDLAEFNLKIGR